MVSIGKMKIDTIADLEVQLVQLNHCDGVYSNYWNTLLKNLRLSSYISFYVEIRPWDINKNWQVLKKEGPDNFEFIWNGNLNTQ